MPLVVLGAAAVFSTIGQVGAQVNQPVGDMPTNKFVMLSFEVTINKPLSVSVTQLTVQGTVSGGNFSTCNSDDPETTTVGDATVTALFNDPPELDLNGPDAGQDINVNYTEQIPVLIAAAGTIQDGEENDLVSLKATLQARPDGNAIESLSLAATASAVASGAGLTVAYAPASGELLITGTASLAIYQSVLQGIQYNNSSDTPSVAARQITVVASDGTPSISRTATVAVNPVNDLPVGANKTVTMLEDGSRTFSTADFVFSDLDGDSFAGIEIVSLETAGDLEAGGVDVVLGQAVADVASLVFKPDANAYGSPYAAFSFKVKDSTGALSANSYQMTIQVSPMPDTPSVTTATTTEGSQTSAGLVVSVNPVDGTEVTHFVISGITHGTLYQHDGTTVVNNGNAITVAAGASGLRFSPTPGLYSPDSVFSFNVSAALDASGTGASSPTTASITVNPRLDFGDAPDPGYPSLLANNGARHVVLSTGASLYLGATVDTEADAAPNAGATGDDIAGSDDEDGVVLPAYLPNNQSISLSVTASAPGLLSAWIDYNRDGDWNDAGEQIFADQPVVAGVNSLSINTPATFTGGASMARFRLSTQSGLAPTGIASDGEVEDYAVTLNSTPLAVADTIGRYPTQSAKVQVGTLLSNDSDSDGDTISLTGVDDATPAGAVVTRSGDWVLYSPPAGSTSPGSFTYTVADPLGATSTATVTVSILSDNGQGRNFEQVVDLGGGTLRLTFNGIPQRVYSVQYTTELNPPNTIWTTLVQQPADAQGRVIYEHTSGSATRFYRCLQP
jgi:hypothetical protein